MQVKKVIILGPESTGKSTLCEQLATHFNTLWCPEFARQYLEKNGPSYNYDDLLIIANGQLSLEEKYTKDLNKSKSSEKSQTLNSILFLDTDMHVIKVWSEFVFGKCHSFILEKLADQHADLYLLCNIDLPWVKDNLREYPELESRRQLFHIYKDLLENQKIPYRIISGNNEQRMNEAIAAVNQIIVQHQATTLFGD